MSGSGAQGLEPTWHSTRCWYQVAPIDAVECGYVEVPERRDRESRSIQIAVTILRSESPTPRPDPIFYLNGGPGFPTYASAGELAWWIGETFPLRKDRDVVIIDQRGLGRSLPRLTCPELIEIPADVVNWPEDLKRVKRTAAKALWRCRERFLDQEIDLTAYITPESARDVDAVATSLGAQRYNLIGTSYGSRLALSVMRQFPGRVRSAVLDGVYPPHVRSGVDEIAATKRVFLKLLDDCQRDRACAAAYPDFKSRVLEWVDGLSPVPRRYGSEAWTRSRVMDPEGLMAMLFDAFRDAAEIATLPDLLASAADGNYRPFTHYFTGAIYAEPSESSGLHFSVQCSDNWSPELREAYDAAARDYYPYGGSPRGYLSWAVCHNWFPEDAPIVDRNPVSSDIPSLILSGGYDMVTPREWGEETALYLPRSQSIAIDAGGHVQLFVEPCALKATTAFFDDPSSDMDAFCPNRHDGLEFQVRGSR